MLNSLEELASHHRPLLDATARSARFAYEFDSGNQVRVESSGGTESLYRRMLAPDLNSSEFDSCVDQLTTEAQKAGNRIHGYSLEYEIDATARICTARGVRALAEESAKFARDALEEANEELRVPLQFARSPETGLPAAPAQRLYVVLRQLAERVHPDEGTMGV